MIRELRPTDADVALGTMLVREYVAATAEELGYDVELLLQFIPDAHDFAGRYLDSGGGYLVAEIDGDVAGGIGITPAANGECEMNRLWVRAQHRRAGVAREMCIASFAHARELGFTRMILDVVPARPGAIALYRSLGFTDAPAAHDYPFPMVFLGRDL
jgi:carbonic anhydrase